MESQFLPAKNGKALAWVETQYSIGLINYQAKGPPLSMDHAEETLSLAKEIGEIISPSMS